jgi:hypothetical protein
MASDKDAYLLADQVPVVNAIVFDQFIGQDLKPLFFNIQGS